MTDMISMEEVKLIEKKVHGYEVLNIITHKPLELCNSKFLRMPFDGVLFSNLTLSPDSIFALRDAGIPFVSTNRLNADGVNWIDYDNEDGLAKSLGHLIAQGHRKIGYIAFKNLRPEHEERIFNTYRHVMQSIGAFNPEYYLAGNYDEDFHILHGDAYYEESGKKMMSKLLSYREPPTAFFSHNLALAKGAYDLLKSRNISVPEQISIIAGSLSNETAVDDDFFSLLVAPTEDRILLATETLLGLIENPIEKITQKLLPRELIIKKSTGSVPGDS